MRTDDILNAQDLTLVELCAQRKQRLNHSEPGKESALSIFKLFRNGLNSPWPRIMRISSEADPPPAYSRRGSDSEAESSPADQPPSYTRARCSFLVGLIPLELWNQSGHCQKGMKLAAGPPHHKWSKWPGNQKRSKGAVMGRHRSISAYTLRYFLAQSS